jgi:hypothetical protein
MSSSRWFLTLWLGVISGTTLVPFEPVERAPAFFCMLCGFGAAADVILNVALFLPLGVALSTVGWRPVRALTLGALLSLGIETAQFAIPGRDPSFSDVLSNALGTVIGIALARSVDGWWRPGPRLSDVLTIGAALGATSVLAVTGVLFAPSFPEDTYYGGWTPRFGHLEWYGGRVLEVSVDGLQLPPGLIAPSALVRQRLLADPTIVVRAYAGPRQPGLAPLFSIHDHHQREIVLLGVDGDDFVYRYRTRAIGAGFTGAGIRVRGALHGIARRAPLSIVVRRADSGYCVRVNATERCGVGYTVGTGWTLLLGTQPVPFWLHPVLNVVWLAALFFPSGLWSRSGWAFAVAAALTLAGLLAAPVFTGLLPTPGIELLAAVAGFLGGWASRRRFGF